MNVYFSTFITGFAEVIKKKLEEDFPDIKVDLLLDGLVVYSTSATINKIQNLRYFNNSFILLKKLIVTPEDKTKRIVKRLSSDIDFKKTINTLDISNKASFRLIVSKENQMIGVDKTLIKNMETQIISSTLLQLNPLKADWEFWFLIRKEGYAFSGIRLTGLSSDEPKPLRGELRRELAHLLCIASEPNRDDIFLDPFCGSGSIAIERAKSFPYKKIISGDLDTKSVNLIKTKTSSFKNFIVTDIDALNLRGIEDSSIDKIVTDPPWGFYNRKGTEEIDFNLLYGKMLKEFKRVIKPNGIIVVLTGRKNLFEDLLKKIHLNLEKKYDILVSGKKAGVYILKV